ncbi:hypothetical protein niasHT_024202 [Heterodera trifolii]|uniref:Mediator of RNA polymerase II transcription subunit 22 n=1 Tax=Heterodera trifolii TaxID=157864 RepID=A0ABD2JLW4_9BILA
MAARSNTNKEALKNHQTSKTIATKKLVVQDYKNRLKDNIKSLNDNFECILGASKVNCDDATHRSNSAGKLGEHYAIRNEAIARAALLVKATNELKMLTNEIREFLTIRDFNFISNSIAKAEEDFKKRLKQYENDYSALRMSISTMASEIDRELVENSLYRF